jgi:hypothetical protein
MFTRASTGTYPELHKSSSHPSPHFFKIHFTEDNIKIYVEKMRCENME